MRRLLGDVIIVLIFVICRATFTFGVYLEMKSIRFVLFKKEKANQKKFSLSLSLSLSFLCPSLSLAFALALAFVRSLFFELHADFLLDGHLLLFHQLCTLTIYVDDLSPLFSFFYVLERQRERSFLFFGDEMFHLIV